MRPTRTFWLINTLLLLLYAWTLGEATTVAIHVEDGFCTAIVAARHSTIPCPGLEGGSVHFYSQDEETADLFQAIADCGVGALIAPLRLCAPFGVGLQLSGGDGPECLFPDEGACMFGTAAEVTVIARLQRPDDPIGIVLTPACQPVTDSSCPHGWVFLLDGEARQAIWREWANGRPSTPLQGIPFDKTAAVQSQSLLRDILISHQGALGLLLVYWSISVLVYWYTRLIRRKKPVNPNTTIPINQYTNTPIYQYDKWLVLFLTFLAFAATLFIASDVLERVPHVQDSVTYHFQAQTLAGGRLWSPAPALPEFFEQEFLIVQDGRWFGKYPPGYPLLLALGVLGGAPWLVNPLLAALTIPLLYILGKLLYDRRVGLLAAVLGLTSPFFLFLSGSQMSHAAELFWVTLFMVAWTIVARVGNPRYMAAVAGIALGMLFLTRQVTAVTLALTFGPGLLLEPAKIRSSVSLILRSPAVLRFVTIAILTCLPFLLLLPLYQWAVTGDSAQDPRTLYWAFDRLGFGQDIGEGNNIFNLVQTEVGTAVQWLHDPTQPLRGHTFARGLFNTGRNLQALLTHLFGWPVFLTLAFVWFAFLLGRPQRHDWLLLVFILAHIALHVAYWADGIMYGPRYWYGLLPAFLLLTARGVGALGRGAEEEGSSGVGVVGVVVLLLLLGNLAGYLPRAVETYRGFNFVSGRPLAEVEAAVEGKAVVFIAGHEADWWTYGQFFSDNNPWLDGRLIYARDLGEENGRLLALYPNRPAYRWQDGQLTRIK